MKKIAIACMIGLFLCVGNVYSGQLITMTGEQWPPYNNYINNKEKPGFMFEIVELILKKDGYRFRYTERPWARAIEDTRSGMFNALIGPGKGDAPDFVFPEEEIGFTVNEFFTRVDSQWKYEGIASLENIKLGVLKSMTYGNLIDKFVQDNQHNRKRINIISGENYLSRNLIKLEKERIDATIDDSMVIRHFLAQTGKSKMFKSAGIVGDGYGIYIAFSPKYPHAQKLSNIITKGVRELRKNGTLVHILSKYGASDWK